jgi:hypothetical protein
MATQNPIETEGTYPLPEAQVDRFMMKVLVGYPSEEEEFVIVERVTGAPAGVGGATTAQLASCSALPARGYRRPVADPVRGASWWRDARPATRRARRTSALPDLRREPARLDQPDRGRPGAGVPARPRLRAARGPRRPRARRAAPPAGAVLRGADRGQTADQIVRAIMQAVVPPPAKPLEKPMSASPRTPERAAAALEWTVVRGSTGCCTATTGRCSAASGLDLADLREYQFHDDVRHIDWNVTARLQTPYVREYNEDREVTAWFLLDLSPSIDFGSGEPPSARCSREFVGGAGAAADAARQQASARMLYGDRIEVGDPARQRPAPGAATAAGAAAAPAPARAPPHRSRRPAARGQGLMPRRSLAFVVSDFISTPGWEKPLAQLAQRHEVLAVRLYDPLPSRTCRGPRPVPSCRMPRPASSCSSTGQPTGQMAGQSGGRASESPGQPAGSWSGSRATPGMALDPTRTTGGFA